MRILFFALIITFFSLQSFAQTEENTNVISSKELLYEESNIDNSKPSKSNDASGDAIEKPIVDITEYENLQYGRHPRHKLDVYAPKNAKNAPILFLVHGGAWRFGNKSSENLVKNKLAKWGQENFILVSTNYRLLPTFPYNQAHDLRHALRYTQEHAKEWGGDPSKIILMGHSAGGHLVALVNSNPDLATKLGVKPWLGAVVLDSAALDVVALMSNPKHANAYDRAFGSKLYVWNKSSPYHQLTNKSEPFLFVCSTRREKSCPQAEKFVKKALKMGVDAHISEQDLSHKSINTYLGGDNEYTDEVDNFIKDLLN